MVQENRPTVTLLLLDSGPQMNPSVRLMLNEEVVRVIHSIAVLLVILAAAL